MACGLKCHWYLRISSLKFQKARTKIETANRAKTGKLQFLVLAFSNFKLKVLEYQFHNFRPHATVISKFCETLGECTMYWAYLNPEVHWLVIRACNNMSRVANKVSTNPMMTDPSFFLTQYISRGENF